MIGIHLDDSGGTTDAQTIGNKTTSECRSPQMFNGDRHHFHPSTTSIASVLTGLSSKHSETARQVIQEIILLYGEQKFSEEAHVIVADQEFMPAIFTEFFSRLVTDEPLPIIPTLAVGHAMKGLSVSMMAFYKCFFNPMLEAIGTKIDSAEYNRLFCLVTSSTEQRRIRLEMVQVCQLF